MVHVATAAREERWGRTIRGRSVQTYGRGERLFFVDRWFADATRGTPATRWPGRLVRNADERVS